MALQARGVAWIRAQDGLSLPAWSTCRGFEEDCIPPRLVLQLHERKVRVHGEWACEMSGHCWTVWAQSRQQDKVETISN